MDKKMNFKYFYGTEADQFSFYRIPKALFTNECFKDLSSDAKILYGLMLDRMSLSIKNQWFDEENRALVVYIISIMAAAIISILYSYFFYKKKLATGEGLKIQYNTKKCDISDHRNFRYCVYYMDFVLGKHSDSL